MQICSVQEVLKMIRKGQPVTNVRIIEHLDIAVLAKNSFFRKPIRLVGCQLQSIEAGCVIFTKLVELRDVRVESRSSFCASYFNNGLVIEHCYFGGGVDFQCGGHNKLGKPVLLSGTRFRGFVNFFDCWFEGPVEIRDCYFDEGTNLLGNKGKPYDVTFDIVPIIENTTGSLDLNGG